MSEIHPKAKALLAAHGWEQTTITPLPSDASARCYLRATQGKNTIICMDCSYDPSALLPYITMTEHLQALNLHVPDILAQDLTHGFLLLEDMGNRRFTEYMRAHPQEELPLLKAALDILIDLHHQPAQKLRSLAPAYTQHMLQEETEEIITWYYPLIYGNAMPEEAATEYHHIWINLLATVDYKHQTLILRDYHTDNLMWLPHEAGRRRVGVLDFQDAVYGHAAYDLLSLLESPRYVLSHKNINLLLAYYLENAKPRDPSLFERSYAILAAQRNCKILGRFARLWLRDQKPGYLPMLPDVWHFLMHDMRHAALHPLKNWMDRHFPASARTQIPEAKNLTA